MHGLRYEPARVPGSVVRGPCGGGGHRAAHPGGVAAALNCVRQCFLMALADIHPHRSGLPLLGVKRTSESWFTTSVIDPKRKSVMTSFNRFNAAKLSARLRLLGHGRQRFRCGHQAPDRSNSHSPHTWCSASKVPLTEIIAIAGGEN